jgi:hypothetical protein
VPLTGPDPQFFYSFSGPGVSGFGTLSAVANGDGTYTAISDPGVVTSTDLGTLPMNLITNPSPTGLALSPSGFFLYDDQLAPSANPMLTLGGLLFSAGGAEINVYSNGPGAYTYYESNGFNVPVNFTLTPVPEPSRLFALSGLLGMGLIGLVWRRRK